MASYELLIVRSAEREIEGLPPHVRRLLVERLRRLADQPRPPGSEKLSGSDAHRIRQGAYRAVYRIDDARRIVTVLRAAHRSDVYRRQD